MKGYKDLSEDREAVGICSRPAVFSGVQCDGVEPAVAQQTREKHFPLELARLALTLRLQDAKASVEADRVKILNELG